MLKPDPQVRYLNGAQRLLLLLLNLSLGIFPSFAFFEWIERNATLPYLGPLLGFPWIGFQFWPLGVTLLWDFSLFLVFGFLHSLFAQPKVHRALEWAFPPQSIRTIYMMVTGLTAISLMGLWQNTGVVLWALPFGANADLLLSLLIYWSFMLASGLVMRRFDSSQFVGLKQLYMRSDELNRTEGTPALLTGGIFRYVRHPIYTFTFSAIILTPVMTADRALLFLAMAVYLIFAIPVEERKLIAIFGPAYEEYRRKVPAVIPFLPSLSI